MLQLAAPRTRMADPSVIAKQIDKANLDRIPDDRIAAMATESPTRLPARASIQSQQNDSERRAAMVARDLKWALGELVQHKQAESELQNEIAVLRQAMESQRLALSTDLKWALEEAKKARSQVARQQQEHQETMARVLKVPGAAAVLHCGICQSGMGKCNRRGQQGHMPHLPPDLVEVEKQRSRTAQKAMQEKHEAAIRSIGERHTSELLRVAEEQRASSSHMLAETEKRWRTAMIQLKQGLFTQREEHEQAIEALKTQHKNELDGIVRLACAARKLSTDDDGGFSASPTRSPLRALLQTKIPSSPTAGAGGLPCQAVASSPPLTTAAAAVASTHDANEEEEQDSAARFAYEVQHASDLHRKEPA